MIVAHEPVLREILTTVGEAPFFTKDLRAQGMTVPNGKVFSALRNAKCLIRVARVQGINCWQLDPAVLEGPPEGSGSGEGADLDDVLYEEAARLVVTERQASASFLQRRMRIGFSRAGRLIDMMEREGLLGPQQGSKSRDVLVKPDYFEELDRARRDG